MQTPRKKAKTSEGDDEMVFFNPPVQVMEEDIDASDWRFQGTGDKDLPEGKYEDYMDTYPK